MKQVPLYHCTHPCNTCPYRMDVPLRHWSIEEFRKLLDNDQSQIGVVYRCHKKNGSACIGWLMNQEKNNFPSLALRISLIKHDVNRSYLDKLHCKAPMFETVKEMCQANYPELSIK